MALDEPVYAKDNTGAGNSGTAPTVSIAAGFATNAGGGGQTAAACTNLTVTNNSTLAYGLSTGRWACVPKQRLDSLSLPLEIAAFHQHGIAAVVFSAADESAHTVTSPDITAETISTTFGNPPVYATTLDLTGFTSGNVVTANVKCYPVIGDTATDSSGQSWPSAELCAWPYLLDSANTFGRTVVHLDPAAGSDANTAYDIANVATSAANPVATWNRAVDAIAAFNNTTYSRNNVDAGIIYLKSGNQTVGGDSSPPASTKCFLTVTPASGVSAASAPFVSFASAGRYLPKLVRFEGCSFVPSSAANQLMHFGLTTSDLFVWQNCTFQGFSRTSNTSFVSGASGAHMFLGCTMVDYYEGMAGSSSTPLLLRGNTITDANSKVFGPARCAVANTYTGRNGTTDGLWRTSANTNGNIVVAWNKAYKIKDSSMSVNFNVDRFAIVGNIIELIGSSVSPALMINDISVSDTIFWHNTIVGQRTNLLNDITNPLVDKQATRWSIKFNALKSLNVAQHSDDNADTLVGWRSIQYGTGVTGNVAATTVAPGYYAGAYSSQSSSPLGFVLDASRSGTDAGNGDYHPSAGSALMSRIPSSGRLITYDLEGNPVPNAGTGAAGALQIRGSNNFFQFFQ